MPTSTTQTETIMDIQFIKGLDNDYIVFVDKVRVAKWVKIPKRRGYQLYTLNGLLVTDSKGKPFVAKTIPEFRSQYEAHLNGIDTHLTSLIKAKRSPTQEYGAIRRAAQPLYNAAKQVLADPTSHIYLEHLRAAVARAEGRTHVIQAIVPGDGYDAS